MNAPVVVTGAASGIGRALAHRLHRQHEVFALDRAPLDLPGVHAIPCDLRDPDSRRAAVKALPSRLGGVALVAGVPGTAPPEAVLDVNYVGTRALAEALVPRLVEGAAIALVSSISSHRSSRTEEEARAVVRQADADASTLAAGRDGRQAYYDSKHLLDLYGQHLAARGVRQGFRAVVVSPGPVETPILDDFRASMGADRIAAAEAITGRHGTPDEVAAVLAFVLSEEAAWLSGVRLPVDGGFGTARAVARWSEAP